MLLGKDKRIVRLVKSPDKAMNGTHFRFSLTCVCIRSFVQEDVAHPLRTPLAVVPRHLTQPPNSIIADKIQISSKTCLKSSDRHLANLSVVMRTRRTLARYIIVRLVDVRY